jgi:hypothetical protein
MESIIKNIRDYGFSDLQRHIEENKSDGMYLEYFIKDIGIEIAKKKEDLGNCFFERGEDEVNKMKLINEDIEKLKFMEELITNSLKKRKKIIMPVTKQDMYCAIELVKEKESERIRKELSNNEIKNVHDIIDVYFDEYDIMYDCIMIGANNRYSNKKRDKKTILEYSLMKTIFTIDFNNVKLNILRYNNGFAHLKGYIDIKYSEITSKLKKCLEDFGSTETTILTYKLNKDNSTIWDYCTEMLNRLEKEYNEMLKAITPTNNNIDEVRPQQRNDNESNKDDLEDKKLYSINAAKTEAIYNFCINTEVIGNVISNTDFINFVSSANFKSLQDNAIKNKKKCKCKYIIYILSHHILALKPENKEWYRDAANSIGIKPEDCSKITVPVDWKKQADSLK